MQAPSRSCAWTSTTRSSACCRCFTRWRRWPTCCCRSRSARASCFSRRVNTSELLRALAERGVTIFACVPQFFYLIHQRVTTRGGQANVVVRRRFRGPAGVERRRPPDRAEPGRRAVPARAQGPGRARCALMVTGGSRFDPAIGADLYGLGFNILQAYGLTETSGAATLTRPGDPALDTVGQPLPGNEVRIAPPEAGADAEAAPTARSLIRGPIVMRGYFNRPDATAAALRDGWLYTGDLGRLDAAGPAVDHRAQEGDDRPQLRQEHLPRGDRGALPQVGLHQGTVRARPGAARRAGRRAAVCRRRARRPGACASRRSPTSATSSASRWKAPRSTCPHHKRVLGYEIWMEPLPRTSTGKIKRFEIERRVRSAAEAKRDRRPRPERCGPRVSGAAGAGADPRDDSPGGQAGRDAHAGRQSRTGPRPRLDGARGAADGARAAGRRRHPGRGAAAPLHRARAGRVAGRSTRRRAAARARPRRGPRCSPPRPQTTSAFREWLQPHWLVPGMLFVALKIVRLLLRPGVHVTVEGVEHFPARGPYLISPNHQSYLDPFFLMAALPYRLARQMFFVGASEYFETPVTRWLARQVNLVPVDPDAAWSRRCRRAPPACATAGSSCCFPRVSARSTARCATSRRARPSWATTWRRRSCRWP